MSRVRVGFLVGVVAALLVVIALSCKQETGGDNTTTTTTSSGGAARYAPIPKNWKETEVDVFPGMDGFTLDPSKPDEKEALRGRIAWNLWIGDSRKMGDFLG